MSKRQRIMVPDGLHHHICTCLTCGTQFRLNNGRLKEGRGRFCSHPCSTRAKHEEQTQERVCQYCGNVFRAKDAMVKIGKAKYCSVACQHTAPAAAARLDRICERCGKQFSIKRGQLTQGRKGKRCSAACYNEVLREQTGSKHPRWKGGVVERKCLVCRTPFARHPSQLKSGKFCGPRCYVTWLHLNKSGPNHPNWQGGISQEEYGQGWKEKLKESIRDRDGRKCQWCKTPENGKKLSVHHINYDKKNLDPKNLITLCISCHAKTNYNRDYWRFILTFFVKGEMLLTEVYS